MPEQTAVYRAIGKFGSLARDAALARKELRGLQRDTADANVTNKEFSSSNDDVSTSVKKTGAAFSGTSPYTKHFNAELTATQHEASKAASEVSKFGDETDDTHAPLNKASSDTNFFSRALAKLQGSMRGARSSGKDFGALLSTFKLPVIIEGISLLTGAISSLGAGLAALIPRLAQTIGLLGALPALLGGLIAGVATTVLGFKGIGGAVKAISDQQANAEQNAASYRDAQVSAARAVEGAQRSLADAHDAVAAAEENLTRAHREALYALQDLRIEADRSSLSQRSAEINLIEARRHLAELSAATGTSAPTDLEFEQAQLAVKNAELDVKDAKHQNTRTQQELNEAEAKGVSGSDQVTAAQDQLQQALQGVQDAQLGVTDAMKAQSDAATALTSQQQKMQEAFRALTPEAIAFAHQIFNMRDLLDKLRATAQRGIIPGASTALTRLATLFPIVNRGIEKISGTIGNIFRQLSAEITSPAWQHDLPGIFDQFNMVVERSGHALVYFLDIMRNVIVAAKPMTDWFTRLIESWLKMGAAAAQAGRDTGAMTDFFERSIDALTQLGHVLRDTYYALFNTFKIGQDVGQSFWDSIEEGAATWREWTESVDGSNSIREWFERSKPVLESFVRLLGAIGKLFFRQAEESSDSLANIFDLMRTDLVPAIDNVFKSLHQAFGPELIRALVNFANLIAIIGGHGGTLVAFLEVLNGVVETVVKFVNAVPGIKELLGAFYLFSGAAAAVKFLGNVIKGYFLKPLFQAGETVFKFGQRLVEVTKLVRAQGFVQGLIAAGGHLGELGTTIRSAMIAASEGVTIFGTTLHIALPELALIVAAILLVAYIIKRNWGTIKKVAIDVWNSVKATVVPIVGNIKEALIGAWNSIKDALGSLWDSIQEIFSALWPLLKPVLKLVVTVFAAQWILEFKAIAYVMQEFADLVEWVASVVTKSLDFLANVVDTMTASWIANWEILKTGFTDLADWIGDKVDWLVDKFKFLQPGIDLLSKAVNLIPGASSGTTTDDQTGALREDIQTDADSGLFGNVLNTILPNAKSTLDQLIGLWDAVDTGDVSDAFTSGMAEIRQALYDGEISATEAQKRVDDLANSLGVTLPDGADVTVAQMGRANDALHKVDDQLIAGDITFEDAADRVRELAQLYGFTLPKGADAMVRAMLEVAAAARQSGAALIAAGTDQKVVDTFHEYGSAAHLAADQMGLSWTEFNAELQTAIDNMDEDGGASLHDFVSKVQEALRAWKQAAQENFNGVQDALDAFVGDNHVSTQQILDDFNDQLDAMDHYGELWTDVSERGGKDAQSLLDHVHEMGLDGIGILTALADANDKQFQRIVDKWNDGKKGAIDLAGGVNDELTKSIEGLTEALNDINTTIEIALKLDTTKANTAIADFNERLENSGLSLRKQRAIRRAEKGGTAAHSGGPVERARTSAYGAPRSNEVDIRAEKGEFMVRRREARKSKNRAVLHRMNQGKPLFHGGGQIEGSVTGSADTAARGVRATGAAFRNSEVFGELKKPNLVAPYTPDAKGAPGGATPALAGILGWIKQNFNLTYGPIPGHTFTGTVGYSQHAYGNAVDMFGSAAEMMKEFTTIVRMAIGREIRNVGNIIHAAKIWNIGGGLHDYTPPAGTSDLHYGHVHLDMLPQYTGTPPGHPYGSTHYRRGGFVKRGGVTHRGEVVIRQEAVDRLGADRVEYLNDFGASQGPAAFLQALQGFASPSATPIGQVSSQAVRMPDAASSRTRDQVDELNRARVNLTMALDGKSVSRSVDIYAREAEILLPSR
jgi:hypothetical protein